MNTKLFGRIAAVAGTAVFLAVGATSAQAQNPFGPKIPFTPPTKKTPHTAPAHNDRPFSTPAPKTRRQYRSVQAYLIGIWNGRLNNGTTVRISFSRNGRFAIVNRNRGVTILGFWRVRGLRIQMVAVGQCRNNRCHRYSQRKRVNFNIRPQTANTMKTPCGTLHRAA